MKDPVYYTEQDESRSSPRHEEEKEKRLKVSSEREKEKTKMRERHRRSITTKILTGLRKHGKYNLPPRADINDVLRALAMEAGWVVEADGTTYRSPTFGGPNRPRLSGDCGVSTTRSVSNAGSLNPPSCTPVPSGSSLHSLGGFECTLPPFNIDPLDSTGGDCSTTSSPRHVSTAVNLLQPDSARFLSAVDEETPLARFTNPLALAGFPGRYMLGNEDDVFGLRDDMTLARLAAYQSTHTTESREPISGKMAMEAAAPGLAAFPDASASMTHQHHDLYSVRGDPLQYGTSAMLSSVLLYAQPNPFLQESRASNQNTPIGSPQHHSGTF